MCLKCEILIIDTWNEYIRKSDGMVILFFYSEFKCRWICTNQLTWKRTHYDWNASFEKYCNFYPSNLEHATSFRTQRCGYVGWRGNCGTCFICHASFPIKVHILWRIKMIRHYIIIKAQNRATTKRIYVRSV